MATAQFGNFRDSENFANILFLPPQLSGPPQTPTASAAPKANTPGASSGRTPTRTAQQPPLSTALERPFQSQTAEKGQHDHAASGLSDGARMQEWDKHPNNVAPNISDGVLRGARPIEYEGTWVTLFGFAPQDLPVVLREFLPCGDITNYDTSEKGPAGNWVHVQFRTQEGAQRALLKDGTILNGSLIVGVQPPSLDSRIHLEGLQREKQKQQEEIIDESDFQGILSLGQPLQTTGHPTPLSGPFSSEKRLSSSRRPPIPESDMPQPSWQWLRPIGVLFGF